MWYSRVPLKDGPPCPPPAARAQHLNAHCVDRSRTTTDPRPPLPQYETLVSIMDDTVGAAVAALRGAGVWDETLVLMSSGERAAWDERR